MKRWIIRGLPISLLALALTVAVSLPARQVKAQDPCSVSIDGSLGHDLVDHGDGSYTVSLDDAGGVYTDHGGWFANILTNKNCGTLLSIDSGGDEGTNLARNYVPCDGTLYDYVDANFGLGLCTWAISFRYFSSGDITFTFPSSGDGGGTLTRPLTSGDEADTDPLYDLNAVYDDSFNLDIYPTLNAAAVDSVYVWSKAPGAKVHAADAGSIVSVKGLSWDDCGIANVTPIPSDEDPQPTQYTPYAAAGEQPCLVSHYHSDHVAEIHWLDATDVYIVTLQTGDGKKIQYLVKNAPDYVVVGDTVDAGCILGETIPLVTTPTLAINFTQISALASAAAFITDGASELVFGAIALGTQIISAFGSTAPTGTPLGYSMMTLYDTDDSILELASQLTVEPTSDSPCNQTGDYKDCLAQNPQFAQGGKNWIAVGNVAWTEPGVELDPGESVYQQLQLLDTSDYTATAYTEGANGGTGQIRLTLGSHTEAFTSSVEWTSVQLSASPLGAADAGSFYTVAVQNVGQTTIEVSSLCVTDGSPNTGPNSCYFNNQSFVEGTSGWTVSDGVTASDQALNVPDNGVISQNVMLNPLPGGPATYHLVVRGDWIYTGTDIPSGASAIASIKYEWPDGSGYQDMIPINITGNLAYGAGTLAFMADIEVSDTTDDLMNIKVETTDAGDFGVTGIRITDACLSTVDGGSFPGQGGGGAPPPLDANCTYVSRPQNNDPAAWLQWHWEKLNQYFTCDLRITLNKMYTLGQQSYRLAGWNIRYMQSQLKLWTSWLGSQFIPWLNGQFRNMAIGQVTTVYQSGGSCNDIFCVLNTLISGILTPINNIVNTVLGLINTAANLLFTILTGVIGLGLAFLGRLFGLFNQVISLFTGIIGAYSTATPATITGLPTCGIDPTSSPFCRATWVLDNTILGGRWAVLLTVILGIASIHLLIWVIGEIRGAIINVGGSS